MGSAGGPANCEEAGFFSSTSRYPPTERLEQVVEALRTCELSDVYVLPEAKALLEHAA